MVKFLVVYITVEGNKKKKYQYLKRIQIKKQYNGNS